MGGEERLQSAAGCTVLCCLNAGARAAAVEALKGFTPSSLANDKHSKARAKQISSLTNKVSANT